MIDKFGPQRLALVGRQGQSRSTARAAGPGRRRPARFPRSPESGCWRRFPPPRHSAFPARWSPFRPPTWRRTNWIPKTPSATSLSDSSSIKSNDHQANSDITSSTAAGTDRPQQHQRPASAAHLPGRQAHRAPPARWRTARPDSTARQRSTMSASARSTPGNVPMLRRQAEHFRSSGDSGPAGRRGSSADSISVTAASLRCGGAPVSIE